MLCGSCEDLFSRHESKFARLVFHPLAAKASLNAKYGGWLRKFAVSVCWRILEEGISSNELEHFAGRWTSSLASCRDTWKRYLTGKRPDIVGHHVHLLTWSDIRGRATPLGPPRASHDAFTGHVLPSEIQTRHDSWADVEGRSSIQNAIFCSDREAFIYAKLGPIILLGLIADPDPAQWHGTRINAEGKLKPREMIVPAAYREYLRSRM